MPIPQVRVDIFTFVTSFPQLRTGAGSVVARSFLAEDLHELSDSQTHAMCPSVIKRVVDAASPGAEWLWSHRAGAIRR